MHFREAIVAAGCTRLRPVLLTALTTILGLLPMVTGVSFNFHTMEIAWVSESTQWWKTMAVAVIFGLAFATILTLIVVPVLYSLVYTTTRSLGCLTAKIHGGSGGRSHLRAPENDAPPGPGPG
jgi:multidrug efflux pump subunit AcrB